VTTDSGPAEIQGRGRAAPSELQDWGGSVVMPAHELRERHVPLPSRECPSVGIGAMAWVMNTTSLPVFPIREFFLAHQWDILIFNRDDKLGLFKFD
jgi:hypothetical protein